MEAKEDALLALRFSIRAPTEALAVGGHVIGLDLAAREDIVAGGEFALGVALEQQGLDFSGCAVSQEDEGGSRRWDNGRERSGLGHRTVPGDCHTGGRAVQARANLGPSA